jgi:hypothetical protein
MAFAFDQEKHEYTLNGLRLPSVTQILESVGLSPDFSGVPAADLEFARQRGSAVHLATAYDDRGDLDEDSLDPRIAPYLEAWRQFRRDFHFEPTEIEFMFYSKKHGYAGTLDRFGPSDLAPYTLIDLKTAAKVDLTATGPQTGAYSAGYCEFTGQALLKQIKRYAVQLQPDGYKLIECKDRQDFDAFLHALSLVNWKNKRR